MLFFHLVFYTLKKCWVKHNPVLGKIGTNPAIGFVPILPSTGSYLTQHFLDLIFCCFFIRTKDELGVLSCQHAFHKRCLVKWLEVSSSCPMCNNPISAALGQTHSPGNLLDELF
uniref:cullin-RING-type E3 NEDD8 transferase n=1 Tax=Sinocyclocheilus grahami TaxID=75366 RepID=A0A672L4Z7_SINGR